MGDFNDKIRTPVIDSLITQFNLFHHTLVPNVTKLVKTYQDYITFQKKLITNIGIAKENIETFEKETYPLFLRQSDDDKTILNLIDYSLQISELIKHFLTFYLKPELFIQRFSQTYQKAEKKVKQLSSEVDEIIIRLNQRPYFLEENIGAIKENLENYIVNQKYFYHVCDGLNQHLRNFESAKKNIKKLKDVFDKIQDDIEENIQLVDQNMEKLNSSYEYTYNIILERSDKFKEPMKSYHYNQEKLHELIEKKPEVDQQIADLESEIDDLRNAIIDGNQLKKADSQPNTIPNYTTEVIPSSSSFNR